MQSGSPAHIDSQVSSQPEPDPASVVVVPVEPVVPVVPVPLETKAHWPFDASPHAVPSLLAWRRAAASAHVVG